MTDTVMRPVVAALPVFVTVADAIGARPVGGKQPEAVDDGLDPPWSRRLSDLSGEPPTPNLRESRPGRWRRPVEPSGGRRPGGTPHSNHAWPSAPEDGTDPFEP
jgi:hypothetical protein